MERKTVFEHLNGMPAQVLVVVGLALTLVMPLIPRFRIAAVNDARTAYDNAEAMIELEMEQIKRDQERELKASNNTVAMAGMTWEQQQAQNQDRAKKAAELERVADDKREALKKQYDRTKLKRTYLNAQRNLSGTRYHMLLGWLGSLALIVGLLTLTVASTGVTQKIYLVILLVVMFSALSGVNVGFLAAGQMGGDESRTMMEALRK